jgi:hypothetical protein
MTTHIESELKKLKKAVGEAVRRGIEFDDWMAECVLRLSNRDGDPPDHLDQIVATNACSMMWAEACEEEGIKI